jgi:quercetin dioxygenase-like cupin family protein
VAGTRLPGFQAGGHNFASHTERESAVEAEPPSFFLAGKNFFGHPHAASGEVVDIRPLGAYLRQTSSSTLVGADRLEIFRLLLSAGKATPDHKASGAITIQCLEGAVELEAHGCTHLLRAGSPVYLADAEPHAVKTLEDSSLLVTVLLKRV